MAYNSVYSEAGKMFCCTGIFKSARNHFVIQIFSKDCDELKEQRDDERQCNRAAEWSGAVRTSYRSWEPSLYDKQQCTPRRLTWSVLVVFFSEVVDNLLNCRNLMKTISAKHVMS